MNMRILNDGGIDGAHKDAEYDAINKWWINNESVDYTGKLDVKGVLTELKGKLDGGTATAADFSQALTVYTTLQRAAKTAEAINAYHNLRTPATRTCLTRSNRGSATGTT